MISKKNIKSPLLIILISTLVIIFFILNLNFYFSDFLISKLSYTNSIPTPHSSLAIEISNLRADSKIHESILKENEELKKILKLQNENRFSLINAEITIKSPTIFSATAYANKGKKSGIVKNLIAINGEGLVGKIGNVYDDYSEIIFSYNPRFNLLVFVGENKVPGILKGDGIISYIKYISSESKIKIEDHVYLADNVNPNHINFQIGNVSAIRIEEGFLRIKVKNLVNPNTVKFISIIKNDKI